LVNLPYYYFLKAGFAGCQKIIETGYWMMALEYCQLLVVTIMGLPTDAHFNMYDIRKQCEFPPLCYDFSKADNYLNQPQI